MNRVWVWMVLLAAGAAVGEEDRILMKAVINGQAVVMAFDTGAEGPVLFAPTVGRLGLKVQEPPTGVRTVPGEVVVRKTEVCRFQVEDGEEFPAVFAVIDLPGAIQAGCDGMIGWGAVKHMKVILDPVEKRVDFSTTVILEDETEWKCLDIRTDLKVLAVKLPGGDDKEDCLLIDTGDSSGLTVRRELWPAGADPNVTLQAAYMPGVGLTIDRVTWVREMHIGGLFFHDIPVLSGLESHQAFMDMGIDASAGMFLLSCYRLIIVDGPAGKIYFKPGESARRPETYEYNRLGAVFVPEDIQTSNALIAHVVKGGPAWKAGIRDGDELRRIGTVDVTRWRTDPEAMPGRFTRQPAGTRLDLMVLRDGRETEVSVALEEIFRR